jgi:hypothetical protein
MVLLSHLRNLYISPRAGALPSITKLAETFISFAKRRVGTRPPDPNIPHFFLLLFLLFFFAFQPYKDSRGKLYVER